jgi:hypothetical protein
VAGSTQTVSTPSTAGVASPSPAVGVSDSPGQTPRETKTASRLLKNDSATASQQFPRRLILGSSLCALQKRTQSSLPYCDPWSECTMTGCFGFRLQTAISSASITRSRTSVGCMDHPMIIRLCRSMTTARYSQLCQVRMYVMSGTHAVLGASTSKSRITTFGATGNRCLQSVVTGKRRFLSARCESCCSGCGGNTATRPTSRSRHSGACSSGPG